MDVRIDSESLGRELGLLTRVVSRKPAIPVLANVLVTADMAGLTLAATDTDVSLTSPCPATVLRGGTATIPALKLAEMVRALPGTEIRLTLDEKGAVRLTGGKYQSRLQALPADDYPSLPAPDGLAVRTLPRAALKRLVGQTRFAIADGADTRYLLAGAQLVLGDGSIALVATDSHRLALATEACASAAGDPVLVPKKALDQLAALLAEDGAGDVAFSISENCLFFALDGRTLSARKVDGQFPAWQRIIPKGNDKVATVDRTLLLTALKRVELVASGGARSVLFGLGPSALSLSASSPELGDASEQVAAEYAGAETGTRINGQYVADFLEAAAGASVTMALKDDVSQVLFADGVGYSYVCMPMRI